MILTFNCLQVQAWLNSLTIQCLSYKKKSHPLTKVFQSCRLCRTICKHAIKMGKNWKEHSFPGTSGGRISIPGYDKTKDYSFLNFEIKRSQYIKVHPPFWSTSLVYLSMGVRKIWTWFLVQMKTSIFFSKLTDP